MSVLSAEHVNAFALEAVSRAMSDNPHLIHAIEDQGLEPDEIHNQLFIDASIFLTGGDATRKMVESCARYLSSRLRRLIKDALSMSQIDWQAMQGWPEAMPSAEVAVFQQELERAIHATLSDTDQQNALIIRLRFGIGSDRHMRLHEIADLLGLTAPQVRKIEADTLLSFRQPSSEAKHLRALLLDHDATDAYASRRFLAHTDHEKPAGSSDAVNQGDHHPADGPMVLQRNDFATIYSCFPGDFVDQSSNLTAHKLEAALSGYLASQGLITQPANEEI